MGWKKLDEGMRYINRDRFCEFWVEGWKEETNIFGRMEPDGPVINIMGAYDDIEKAKKDLADLVRE